MNNFAPDWEGAVKNIGLAYLLTLMLSLAALEVPDLLRKLLTRRP